jgi:hypothetical protein
MSEVALFLAPLPGLLATVFIVWRQHRKFQEIYVAKAVALGVPIPSAVCYALCFGQLPDWFSMMKIFALHAYILLALGAWFLLQAGRGRDIGPISALGVVNIVVFGHLWTVMTTGVVFG